ncbi:MAG: hypothetical protein KatS3mg025_0836 [Bacteroidia bacterium]|jgi:methylated-DNA-protein-cysteine methyltransferase-like protein|nr:MAG: hypothetical protein KatS3mg025_0836 [Bacteroidia bacterium]
MSPSRGKSSDTYGSSSPSSRPLPLIEKIWWVVRAIPPGRVTTYGAIAQYLGLTRGARLVGHALNLSHKAFPPVPAHRVVNRTGLLTGKFHFPTHTAMQERLESEGIPVKNDQVQNFTQYFWDPCAHLPWPEVFFSQVYDEPPPPQKP